MAGVGRVAVPTRAGELAGLERVDYADAFAVPVALQQPPEQWIRLAVETSPKLFRFVRVAHRLLGLQLAPADAPDHPIGWQVLRSTHDEAVLGNAGLLGEARIVGLGMPRQLVLATLIRLNGIPGRVMWSAAAPIHRRVARYILNDIPARAVEAPPH